MLSRLSYQVIWVILSSYQPNKPKLGEEANKEEVKS
jgi:hypothetical protein